MVGELVDLITSYNILSFKKRIQQLFADNLWLIPIFVSYVDTVEISQDSFLSGNLRPRAVLSKQSLKQAFPLTEAIKIRTNDRKRASDWNRLRGMHTRVFQMMNGVLSGKCSMQTFCLMRRMYEKAAEQFKDRWNPQLCSIAFKMPSGPLKQQKEKPKQQTRSRDGFDNNRKGSSMRQLVQRYRKRSRETIVNGNRKSLNDMTQQEVEGNEEESIMEYLMSRLAL